MKRYLYIIIGIIVAAIIAILVLFLFRGSSALSGILPASITGLLPSAGTQGSNNSGGSTTGFGSSTTTGASSSTGQNSPVQSFNMTSIGPIIDYFVDAQGNVTAVQPSGEVIAVSGNRSSTISSNPIGNIISTSFSYDGKMLLVNYGDPGNPQSGVFHVASGTWTGLPQGLHSPQWSPSGYQIAYLNDPGTGASSLSILNAANIKSGIATLLTLSATNFSLQRITKNQFVLSDKPSAQTAGSSWLYSSQTKTLTPIAYETLGFESVWDDSTTTIGLAFFENPNSQKLGLRLIDAAGNDLHDLSFLTLPTKCLFNNETSSAVAATTTAATATSTAFLYCGVPNDPSQLSSAQLPDDYNDGALFTSDKIIKINTNTGELATLWNGSTQSVDATDLKFANHTLYFINRYDQKLYSLVLAQ
jgi:hypothetical protein